MELLVVIVVGNDPVMDYLLLKQQDRGSLCLTQDGIWMEENRTPIELLEWSCLSHGSTLKGRIDAFCLLTGASQKAGVLTDETSKHIYFPTTSMKNSFCVWISYNDIFKVSSIESGNSEVAFASGVVEEIDIDPRVIKKQMKRCKLFLERLESGIYYQEESLNAKTLLKNLSEL